MPNEILYAGLADQRTAEIITGDFLLLTSDRAALGQHPALYYAGDLGMRGSTTIKIPVLGLMGYDALAQFSESGAVPNTGLTDSSITLTIARQSKAYERGDIAKFTDGLGVLSPQSFASDAAMSAAMRLTNMIANVTDDFTQTVGSSGVDLSISNFLAAIALLEVNSQATIGEGEAIFLGHTVQMGDLRTSAATATGGAVQWAPATQEQMVIRGNGYRGRYMGVDLFASGQVPTANAGADRAGGMFVRGAVCWADMSVQAENSADQLVIGGKVLFERSRTAKSALTAYVSHYYPAVSKGLDAAGISIITDA